MTWVLIMMSILSGEGVSVATANFDSQKLCVEAGESFDKMSSLLVKNKFQCVISKNTERKRNDR